MILLHARLPSRPIPHPTENGLQERPHGMAQQQQEWIDSLAENIKQKNHEAAEDYGRNQHNAGVIAEKGKAFFVALTQALQQNVDTLRARLQGDLTASETGVQAVRACELKVTRARFPWVDATIEHTGDHITLDYAKTPGTPGDPAQDRKTCTFAFRVAPDDTLYIADAFAAQPAEYGEPEELARRITETLFAP